MKIRFRSSLITLSLAAILGGFVGEAQAFPGFFSVKKGPEVKNHSTQVVLMKKGGKTVVSIMPDYEGSLDPFAVVLLVPADVTTERISSIKREFVDRLDQVSAPRFHEFWEQDPCDPGPIEQEWQRSLKADPAGGFLGGGMMQGTKAVAKELLIDVNAQKKEGEYTFTLLPSDAKLGDWLQNKGYHLPNGAEARLAPYLQAGMKAVVAEVDTKRIELMGGDRAILSPIRYWTEQPLDSLPLRAGLISSAGKQELLVYVIDPEKRYETANYKNLIPPTNVEVDFAVKERMGEYYGALHDIILEKNPQTFLLEYAWGATGCGQPCATEPLMIYELLSLGADVFEAALPESERKPKPPELTKEEKEQFKESLKGLKPKEKREKEKTFHEERQTIAERKVMIDRNKYVLSRLHYRYDEAGLPQDPKFASVDGHLEGGIALPKGKTGEASTEVKPASESRLQIRYNNFHNWVPVIQCETPERYRWGKAGRDYRGLRKIWLADDLSRKSRTQIKPAEVVKTPIPSLGLGLSGPKKDIVDAGPDAGNETASGKKCGCSVPGTRDTSSLAWLAASAGLIGAFLTRRKRSQ